MIPSTIGKIAIDDVFTTIKLEDNITNVDLLAEREKFHIRKNKPLINGIKYNKSMKTNSQMRNTRQSKIIKLNSQLQETQALLDSLNKV